MRGQMVRRPLLDLLRQFRTVTTDDGAAAGGMKIERESQNTQRETYPSVTFSTTNPT